jgi:phage I-like protein
MKNTLVLICKDVEGKVPAEIQVIPYGHHDTPKGPFTLDDDGARGIIEAFEAQTNDMVIDYEHQTIADPPVEAPAAGWIKKLVNRGAEGIWAVIEWTEKAKQYIANREYRYVSPVFLKRISDNRVIGLINVALTNQPNIDGMVPLANKLGFEGDTNTKEATMKDLLKLLGLSEDAKEEAAIAAVNKLKIALEGKTVIIANKGVLDALGLAESATESEIVATILAMKQSHTKIDDVVKELNTLKAGLIQRDADGAVEMAMKEGKVTPAQKDWALDYAKRDLEGFKVFVSKAPVVVIEGKVVTDQKEAGTGIDDVQTQINKMCGVDEETFRKYNKGGEA